MFSFWQRPSFSQKTSKEMLEIPFDSTVQFTTQNSASIVNRLYTRDATGLNLSGFELIELLIFGLGPSPSLGPILIVELRALGVELRALTRAFAIIVLNDLNACFWGFFSDFLPYYIRFTTIVHCMHILAHFLGTKNYQRFTAGPS